MTTNTLYLNEYLNFIQEFDYDKLIKEQEYLLETMTMDDVKKVSNKLNLVKKYAAKYGITQSGIDKMVSGVQSKIRNMYDSGMSPEEAGKNVSKMLKKAVIQKLKQTKAKYKELRTDQKILIAVLGFICIMVMNTTVALMLMATPIGPAAALHITCVVVAPMVEEALKSFFIAKGMPWVGTGVVFGLELVNYMFNGMKMGLRLGRFLIARLCGLLMHFSTTFVQKKIIDSASEESKSEAMFVAWATGFAIHAMWNLMAVVYAEDIGRLLVK